MLTYIAFLRSINITGHNPIKMTDLSALFNDLDLRDTETYIQSGNIIFSSEDELSVPDISLKIEKAILERFNWVIPVMIRTIEELRKIISVNPFINEANSEPSKMAVILLNEEPSKAQIQKVEKIDYPPDKFKIGSGEIYVYCPNGFGKTRLYTNFFEKKMGVTGTARNWKTMTTILSIAEKR